MTTNTQINLAQAAVLAEEFAVNNGVSAEVLPTTGLDLDPAAVQTLVFQLPDARIIVASDPTPSPAAQAWIAEISNVTGISPEPQVVDFQSLPDAAAVVLTTDEDVAAVTYVSALHVAPQPTSDAGLLSIGVLRHVPLEVAAELGRAKVTMEEILQYGPGSVIELDRTAGSPVDVVVNGSLIARGEVVVLGEEYGVRITEIIGRQTS